MEENEIQQSWWKRNWKWVVPVGGCLFAIILFFVIIGGAIFGVASMVSDSIPHQDAMEMVSKDTRVIELLGEPIEANGMSSSSFNYSNGFKTATLTIPIKGPKGEATLRVEGEGVDDNYTYSVMNVYVEEAEEIINLLESQDLLD